MFWTKVCALLRSSNTGPQKSYFPPIFKVSWKGKKHKCIQQVKLKESFLVDIFGVCCLKTTLVL